MGKPGHPLSIFKSMENLDTHGKPGENLDTHGKPGENLDTHCLSSILFSSPPHFGLQKRSNEMSK